MSEEENKVEDVQEKEEVEETSEKSDKKIKKKKDKPTETIKANHLDNKLEDIINTLSNVTYPVQVSDPKWTLSTGLLCLDLILGGGYRRGRMFTFSGLPGSGKSTALMLTIKAAQKEKMLIFHFDHECACEASYMKRNKIIIDDSYRTKDGSRGYYYFSPDTGDEGYQLACKLIDQLPDIPVDDHNRPIDGPPTALFLIDSYDSMSPADIELDKSPIAAAARMHSRYQKLIRTRLKKKGATMVATNQLRTKPMAFVPTEIDTGGFALQYYSDARVKISRKKEKKEENGKYFSEVKMQCTRNRMAEPFRECISILQIGKGYDLLNDRLQFLVTTGHIECNRGRYLIDDKKLPYKTARNLMKEKSYKELCLTLRTKQSTYERFFGMDTSSDEED